MEPARLISVVISSAALGFARKQVCGVSGERVSHSEKGTCSIAEKSLAGYNLRGFFLLQRYFGLSSPRSDPMPLVR